MHKDQKDFDFGNRASSYDGGFEGRLSQRFYELVLKNAALSAGARVLDVGCGTGTLLKRLADQCAIDGYGIDIEENMILEAKKKCPEMHIELSTCEQTPFEDHTFDALVTCMAYHHFADKKAFAKEAARLTKPGGHLYIADVCFPRIVRMAINGVLLHRNIVGEFCTPQEICERFADNDFMPDGVAFDRYAQLVRLKYVG